MADEVLVIVIRNEGKGTGIAGYHYTVQYGQCQEDAQCEPSFFFLDLKISNIFFISFFYHVLGIPLFLQEEPYQEEVYRDADAEGGYLFLLSILLSAPYDLDAF